MYLIFCQDKPDHTEVRATTRAAHLDFLSRYKSKIKIAGPWLANDNQTRIGTLIVIDLNDKSAVEEFCRHDPYNKAGLFESVIIRPFTQVLP